MQTSMSRGKMRNLIIYFRNRSSTWKQAAKVNRARWLAVLRATRVRDIDETYDYVDELEATADRRGELVDAVNKYRKSRLISDRRAMFELAKELEKE